PHRAKAPRAPSPKTDLARRVPVPPSQDPEIDHHFGPPQCSGGLSATMENPISRRRAAKLIGTTMAGVFLPTGRSRMEAATESSQALLRSIPSTHERLPVIGLGSAGTFNVPPGSPQMGPLAQVLTRFVKLGGKLVDSSPMYGNAERVIGNLAAKFHLR